MSVFDNAQGTSTQLQTVRGRRNNVMCLFASAVVLLSTVMTAGAPVEPFASSHLSKVTSGSRAPSNDLCADAEEIGEIESLPFDNAEATTSGYGPNGINLDLFYEYTASCTGIATISTCGSSFDTKLQVWWPAECPPTYDVAYNNDSGPACAGVQASLDLSVVAGETYLLQVGSNGTDLGEGILTVTCEAPGACCSGSDCAVAYEADCVSGGGVFLGQGTQCGLDCNTNGRDDMCDIALSSSDDCNVNGIPDDCEVDVSRQQIQFPLDVDPQWSTEGQWAFGVPWGDGGLFGSPDPESGYDGPNVYGYNLFGDYDMFLPEYDLTTSAIDCSEMTDVHLSFYRWLGVASPSYDHASIDVSTNGWSWTTVWQNAGVVDDGAWVLQDLDISSYADGESDLLIRWTMGPTGKIYRYCGWNIDNVEVYGNVAGEDCDANSVPDDCTAMSSRILSQPPGRFDVHPSDASYPSTEVYIADDFTFSGHPIEVRMIKFWGMYYPDETPPAEDSFTIKFYERTPWGLPGAVVETAAAGVPADSRTATGSAIMGSYSEYEYRVLISPAVVLQPGSYFVEVSNNLDGSPLIWFWESAEARDPISGLADFAVSLSTPRPPWWSGSDLLSQSGDLAIEILWSSEIYDPTDCNRNERPDDCDISGGYSQDCQGNGIPDECEMGDMVGSNLLVDGSFEDEIGRGSPQWYGYSVQYGTPICSVDSCPGYGDVGPRTGDGWVWLGNRGGTSLEEGYVEQDVVFPSGGGALLQAYIYCPSYNPKLEDYMQIKIDGDVLDIITGPGYNDGYTLLLLDVSPYANGLEHAVKFECMCYGSFGSTDFYVDDVRLIPAMANDCNMNGQPDDCDIDSSSSQDCNGDGIPDECQSIEGCDIIVWTGLGDGTNWSDPLNWCPQIVPDYSNDDFAVYIPDGADVTVDQSATICYLDVGSDATLAIDCEGKGCMLDVNNDAGLTNDGTISILGNENSMWIQGESTNNGVINVSAGTWGAYLYVTGSDPGLAGSGVVNLSGGEGAQIYNWDGGFRNGEDHLVRGAGTIGADLINDGTMLADVDGEVIVLASPNVHINNGVMVASAGGEFDVRGELTHTAGSVFQTAAGGVITVTTLIDGDGDVLASDGVLQLAKGSGIDISGSVIVQLGGILQAATPGAFSSISAAALHVLDTVAAPGTQVVLTAGMSADITGSVIVDGASRGKAVKGSTPPLLKITDGAEMEGESVTVDNGGVILLQGGSTLNIANLLSIDSGGMVHGSDGATAVVTAGSCEISNTNLQGGKFMLSAGMSGTVYGGTVLDSICRGGRGCTPPILAISGNGFFETFSCEAYGGSNIALGDNAQLVTNSQMTIDSGSKLYGTENSQATLQVGDLLIDSSNGRSGELLIGADMSLEVGGNLILGGSRGSTPPILSIDTTEEGNHSINGSFQIEQDSQVYVGPDSKVRIGGSFENSSSNPSIFNWAGELAMGSRGGMYFEAGGVDVGDDLAGWIDNFSMGKLTVEPGGFVRVVDQEDNDGSGQSPCSEALYVSELELRTGSNLRVVDCRIYAGRVINLGGYVSFVGCGEILPIEDLLDADYDGDVDLDDYGLFFECMGGPEIKFTYYKCRLFDVDDDDDVDMLDFANFQNQFGIGTK